MLEPGWSNDRERLLRWSKGFARMCKRAGFEVTAAHVERMRGYLEQERKALARAGKIGRAERVEDG